MDTVAPTAGFNAASLPLPNADPRTLGRDVYDELIQKRPNAGRIRSLIEQGAQLSLYINEESKTLFEVLAENERVVAKVKDLPQFRGQGLVIAAGFERQQTKKIEEFLKDGNIDWTQTDEQGRSALMLAAHQGFRDVVKLLAEKDPDLFRLDNNGWNALMHAAHAGEVSLSEFFIEKKLPVNHRSPSNYAAIDLALVGGKEEPRWLTAGRADLATLLARNGAEINRKNEKGISPVEFLKINGLNRARDEIVEASAEWHAAVMKNASGLQNDVAAPQKAAFKKLGRRGV